MKKILLLGSGELGKEFVISAQPVSYTHIDVYKRQGLERGIRLLQAAEGVFKETTIQARTVIDWIISKYEKTSDNLKPEFTDKMERFLKNISKEDADYIEQAKGTRGGDTKENIINNKLSGLWEEFEK